MRDMKNKIMYMSRNNPILIPYPSVLLTLSILNFIITCTQKPIRIYTICTAKENDFNV